MSMELLMQYATFALMAVGVLAFLTALILSLIHISEPTRRS